MPRKNKNTPHRRFISSHIACDSKRKFKNQPQAQQAAEYQMLLNTDLELSVYQCDTCLGWHLTRRSNDKNIY